MTPTTREHTTGEDITGEDTPRVTEVIDAFIGFADRLVDDFDVLDLTIQLTEDCARLLDVASAALLLADAGGVLHLLAATSEQARSLDLYQLQREEGPCLDCYRTGQPVTVPELGDEDRRWPRFTAAAAEQGIVSVHAIPMRLRGQVLGALGLFGAKAGDLADSDLRLARGLVHVACIALAQHGPMAHANLLPTLQSTIVGRRLLETAKGVLAQVHGLSMDDAALTLRRYAQEHDRRLADVARAVVTIADPHHQQLLTDLGQQSIT